MCFTTHRVLPTSSQFLPLFQAEEKKKKWGKNLGREPSCRGDLLHVLKVVLDKVEGLGVGPEVLDDDAGAADDLPLDALLVDLAEASKLAEVLGGDGELDEVDAVLLAKGGDELDVSGLIAAAGEDAKMGLTLVKGL